MKYVPILVALLLAACGKAEPPPPAAASAAKPAPAEAMAQSPVAAPSAKAGPRIDKPGEVLVNPDFEDASTDGSIPGWTGSQHAGPPSYALSIDTTGAYAGHGSFHMVRTAVNTYGSLTQMIDAAKFAGKTVELSAMLKTKGVGPKGWLLLINAGVPGAIRNSSALTGDKDWQRVSVQMPIPKDARWLTIGVTLRDAGEGWMDNVELKTLD